MRKIFFALVNAMPSWITNYVPADKLMHFLGGLILAAAVWFFARPEVAFAAAAVVGFGKEIHDHIKNTAAEKTGLPKPHSVEVLDAVITALGGLVVFLWQDDVVAFIANLLS